MSNIFWQPSPTHDNDFSWEPSPRVEALLKELEEKWPNANCGLAHIIVDDYNFQDTNIAWCRKLINALLLNSRDGLDENEERLALDGIIADRTTVGELHATLKFLADLEAISEDDRWK